MLVLALAGCMSMDSFFFNPTTVVAYSLDTSVIPDEDIEEVSFPSTDDVTLYGVWVHQPEPGAQVMVYFHGNEGNIDEYFDRMESYWTYGYETLIFDYRGFGKSDGSPSYQGILDDGQAAIDYAADTTGVPPDQIADVGLSLGGAVAVHTAAAIPPQVLVTEDMFASGQTIINDGSGLDMPDTWLLVDEWDNVTAAAEVTVPYFVMHGAADTFIEPNNARQVYGAAHDPKKLWLVPGADHAETIYVDPDGYRERLTCWIDQSCPAE
jgi:hypothetical protein